MKTIKQAIQVMACGMCAVAAAPSALAEAQPGFYLGVGVGQSSFDIDQEELDDIVLDAFFSVGVPVLSAASTFEDGDTSVAFVAGYRFLKYIAIEASYLDLGAAEYRANGTINPPGPATSAPASVNIDVETKGFTIGAVGSLPIGNVFDLHGRLGLFVAETDLKVSATINSIGTASESFDSTSAYVGLGAAFHLGDHFSLSLDWSRYANVADEDEDDDYETDEGFDIDALSLTAMYKF